MKLVKGSAKDPNHSEKISEKEVEEAFIKIIKWIGEDPLREGLQSTPQRIVKAFKEYFKGYSEDPKKILEKTSTTLASLLKPTTLLFGIYAI